MQYQNIEYFNTDYFNKYISTLRSKIKDNTWKDFMTHNKYPFFDVMYDEVPDVREFIVETKYYSEIPIDLISSHNVTGGKGPMISDNNFSRVIDSIEYILNNSCRPIYVQKFGNKYHIVNGKHRFYAHVLLQKNIIPVSIDEMVPFTNPEKCTKEKKGNTHKSGIGGFNIGYHIDDSHEIIWPETILDFYTKYEFLFSDVYRIKMNSVEEYNYSTLSIEKKDGNIIYLNNICTAGNHLRSSYVTMQLLNKLNFKVNMDYISNNNSFVLSSKRDAHNMDLDLINIELSLENDIFPLLMSRRPYTDSSKLGKDETRLVSYIAKHKNTIAGALHVNYFESFYIRNDEYIYHFISENVNGITIFHIFRDKDLPFNNLSVEFIGLLRSDISSFQEFFSTIN